MTKQEAINLIKQAVVVYKGTLQEHQLLQEAIKTIEPVEDKPAKKAENK
jgi:hypothetical protein